MDPAAQEFTPQITPESTAFFPAQAEGQMIDLSDIMTLTQMGMVKWEHEAMTGSCPVGFAPEAATGRTKKALEIKNPTTGEVINKAEGQSQPRRSGRVSLDALARAQWSASQAVASRRVALQKMRPDHSMFSALNVDGLKQLPENSPLKAGIRRGDGKIFVRPCRAPTKPMIEKETPSKSSSQRPLPEVPGNPLAKISASAAQMLAVLSLEPGMGRRKTADKAVPSKHAEDEAREAKRPWKPRNLAGQAVDVDGKEVAETDELPTSAGESHGSDASLEEQEASSLSGEDSNKANEPATPVEQEQENLNEDFFKKAKSLRKLKSKSAAVQEASGPLLQLLRHRFCVADEPAPSELQNFTCQEIDTAEEPLSLWRQDSSQTPVDRGIFGKSRTKSGGLHHGSSANSLPTPSAQAYRLGNSPKTPEDELRRQVQGLLNKVCPESVANICEKIADIQVSSSAELEIIIGIIFKKALSEPHYVETYADLVFGLKPVFPEFPCPHGGKPVTFKSSLLNICQNEFDNLPTSLEASAEDAEMYDAEELEFRRKKTKDRVLANMKLIGHLFLRQLLSAKVIGSIIQELTLCSNVDQVPEEHVIECAVELLTSIGYTLDSMAVGKASLQQVCGRLQDLKSKKTSAGKAVYSKRIQFAIQDLFDIRKAGWTKKVFGAGAAKTKQEIRLEQQRDLTDQARGKEVPSAQQVVAGQRPVYLASK